MCSEINSLLSKEGMKMGKVNLLDCTLRDGGYINDWRFTFEGAKTIVNKLSKTGIEMIEVGFLKGKEYDPEKTLFPDTKSFTNVIGEKNPNVSYVGMLDMSAPVAKECIYKRDADSIDGIRVIFKKDKTEEGFEYCEYISQMGYDLYVNFVGTDQYSDEEFIKGIEKFNVLNPAGMTIVDTFGVIKRKSFLHYCEIADKYMNKSTALCYHAHNNMQQAFGNAEALLDMELDRDVVIDACVFGMGRGAGNLNLELFAEHMNDNFGTNYRIEPMLEIMDEYLTEFYKARQWGYNLPFYLSASLGCHPNYAIYLADKDSLSEKAFRELLKSIGPEDKLVFSKEKAEKYYRLYMDNYIDDKEAIRNLSGELAGKEVLLIAPGASIRNNRNDIDALIEKSRIGDSLSVISVNFNADDFKPDYVFSANMRRYGKMIGKFSGKSIVTSNMKQEGDFVVNFSSYALDDEEIIDNSGLMLIGILRDAGVKHVYIAGMDGYNKRQSDGSRSLDYADRKLDYDFTAGADKRNELIKKNLDRLSKEIEIEFITPSMYA